MEAFVNELAIAEACRELVPRFQPLRAILAARMQHPEIRNALLCSREFTAFPVEPGTPLRTVAMELPRDERMSFLVWVDRHGPFYDDDRLNSDTDLFLFEEEDVTRLGLGEAAARQLGETGSCVYSPNPIAHSKFLKSELAVCQVKDAEEDAVLTVQNFCDPAPLAGAIACGLPEPTSWPELIEQCRERYDHLVVGAFCLEALAPHPFSRNIAQRVVDLLRVLQVLAKHRSETGAREPKAAEVFELHFVGPTPKFSDESEANKVKFLNEMTFPDPSGVGQITCFWHGKIKERQFRIHFEWPISPGTEKIKIVYIGPKISRG